MPDAARSCHIVIPEPLRVLTPEQVCQIDRCLAELDDFGQVTLIKKRGRLRFIEKTQSLSADDGTGHDGVVPVR